jgi:alcohol dehydrogenase
LWYFRGINPHTQGSIGHELIGVIEATGDAVSKLAAGDLVIAPFDYSCGECKNCTAGYTFECARSGAFGNGTTDGGQGEYVRAPFADANLVKVPSGSYDDASLASFLALSDVMSTGYHAAVSAGVKAGDTVAVVGDGAVGLCAIIAAKMLGAERVIALSRHPARQAVAREFGADEIVEARGDDAVTVLKDMTEGIGVDAIPECVGTDESMATCVGAVRAGGRVGAVGVPNYKSFEYKSLFWRNIGIKGGVAPAGTYIPRLLDAVLKGDINPGRVFDFTTDLEHIQDAYEAMDERRAIKSQIKISEV